MITHTEKIKCPDCGTIQDAIVEHTIPFHTYLHVCEKCSFTIMESDWDVVMPETTHKTAMQLMIDWLNEFDNTPNKPTYANMREKAWQLLAVEKQQIVDAFNGGFYDTGLSYLSGNNYY